MESDVLKKLQHVELEMLKMFDKICKEYNLEYFLVGGTLLGAVRHHGFIPWDDDLDVAMPRRSYNKFIQLCTEGILGNSYSLQHTSVESKYWLPFAKIRKNNTLFDEENCKNLSGFNKGIFIDIFPLDYAKKDTGMFFHFKAKVIKNISGIIINRVLERKSDNKTQIFFQFIFSRFTVESLSHIRDCLMQSCKTGDYYINYGSNYKYTKQIMPISVYEPPVRITFEDDVFFAPHNYEQYLVKLFGDWRKLPPEEERRNHNPVNIVFDTRVQK